MNIRKPTPDQPWRVIAGLSGFVALVMGAVGAHAIADKHAAEIIEKASLYQLVHTAVILLMVPSNRYMKLSRLLFLAGIFLFCGSIYAKTLLGWHHIGWLAPVGGICFMLGWLAIAFGAKKP